MRNLHSRDRSWPRDFRIEHRLFRLPAGQAVVWTQAVQEECRWVGPLIPVGKWLSPLIVGSSLIMNCTKPRCGAQSVLPCNSAAPSSNPVLPEVARFRRPSQFNLNAALKQVHTHISVLYPSSQVTGIQTCSIFVLHINILSFEQAVNFQMSHWHSRT